MFIGIDVGGTYTDAVLTDGLTILKKRKVPTQHGNLLSSLLEALDAVLEGQDRGKVKRVVLSTTLVTNVIAEKKYPPVALILTPGPGLAHSSYQFGTLTHFLRGAIDYRGREIVPLDRAMAEEAGKDIAAKGYSLAAVVGKFSNRCSSHETEIQNLLAEKQPRLKTVTGHTVSGELNFPRRVATTMLTAATRDIFTQFIDQVVRSLEERNLDCPSFILKADGGTLPLKAALSIPVETIFSGPAASALGAMAISPRGQTSVVVDVGGTTTDLALILSGEPLLSSKGAVAEGFLTHVRSFAVRSVPLGGDSSVVARGGQIEVLPERRGPAYCLGGAAPTPTDALVFLGRTDTGNIKRAEEIIGKLAVEAGISPQEAAEKIIDKSVQTIVKSIEQMFIEWEQEPAYRVWEILQENKVRPENIVGVGGSAEGLMSDVAKAMGCRAVIPEHAEVANALGAAVAQPTVTATLRIDTENGTYTLMEDGRTGSLPKNRSFHEEEALRLTKDCLFRRAEELGIREYVRKTEVVRSEVFNMVRGWTTTGKIFDTCMQTPRDILFYLGQEEAGHE